MSFVKENKWFVADFYRKIKGLDHNDSKVLYDNEFKVDFRNRISKFYDNGLNRFDIPNFYKELIVTIGEFDGDFVFTNIFFEKNVDKFIRFLKQSGELNTLRFSETNSLPSNFLNYVNQGYISVDDFLKNNLGNPLEVSNSEWSPTTNYGTPIIDSYLSWLYNSLLDGSKDEEIIYFGLMFNKLWGMRVNRYQDKHNELIYLVLYKFWTKYYGHLNENEYVDISKYKNLLADRIGDVFVNDIGFSPFVKVNMDNLSGKEIKGVKMYNEVIELCDKLKTSYLNDSFLKIFQDMENDSKYINEKLELEIISKIGKNEYPSGTDIEGINNIESNDLLIKKNKRNFNKSFYLFEYL